jgi:hypothetical protein
MRSADDYRKMAAERRSEMQRAPSNDLKLALKKLADAYDRFADLMDGKGS